MTKFKKISLEDRENIIKLRKEGETFYNLAKKYNVCEKTIYYHIKREKILQDIIKKKKYYNWKKNLIDCRPKKYKYFKYKKNSMHCDKSCIYWNFCKNKKIKDKSIFLKG